MKVGLSIHGKFRVATENTIFAMPETAIGLFPDVGSMYWLPRLQGGIGNYIGLTGTRLKADDLIYSGIATHYIPSERLSDFKENLVEISKGIHNDGNDEVTKSEVSQLEDILTKYSSQDIDPSQSFLAKNRTSIDSAFCDVNQVEDIVLNLEQDGGEFGSKTLTQMRKMSPTSMKVTLEAIKRGNSLRDVASSLVMEYRLSQGFMQHPNSDFYEGIRALLVDKDNSPRWNPTSLEQVSNELVLSFFNSLGDNDLSLPSSKL